MKWFKNLRVFKFTKPLSSVLVDLNEKLSEAQFTELPKASKELYGWVPPIKGTDLFARDVADFTLLCLQHEEKYLPADVVNRETNKRVEALEEKESRKAFRKERLQIKDDVVAQLLPEAFSKVRKHLGYIDHRLGVVVINTGSTDVAEIFLSNLRNALGSLPVVSLDSGSNVTEVLTSWLSNGCGSNGFEMENDCVLKNPKDDGTAKIERHDLGGKEVVALLESGKKAIKLALSYKDRLTFTIDDKHNISKLKFSDVILEKAWEHDHESYMERCDQDFTIMGLEVHRLLVDMFEVFGSVKRVEVAA